MQHGIDFLTVKLIPKLNIQFTTKDEILGIIENGKGNMPGELLTEEEEVEVEAVASWLAEKK
jgi:hypothetical protein